VSGGSGCRSTAAPGRRDDARSPGHHGQVIDGQGWLARAEAGAAALAVTGPQGGQHFAQRIAAEFCLGPPIGHGATGQHVTALPAAGTNSKGALLRGASLDTGPGKGLSRPVQAASRWRPRHRQALGEPPASACLPDLPARPAHTMAPAAGPTGKPGVRSCVNKTISTPPCATYTRSCDERAL
jgi:hypothetical protein